MKPEIRGYDVIPGFDAIAESRKWKEAAGSKIAGMTSAERVAHFKAVGERYAAERREWERKHEPALSAGA